LIVKVEIPVTRDVSHCDLTEHDEFSPYYNLLKIAKRELEKYNSPRDKIKE